MKKKKKNKDHDNYHETFKNNINKHCLDLPYNFKDKCNNINTNSWFDIKKYDIYNNNDRSAFENSLEFSNVASSRESFYFPSRPDNIKVNVKFNKENITKCQKVKMILNNDQKAILNKWFNAYTDIYNEVVKYIKDNYQYTKHFLSRDIINSNYKDVKIIYNYYTMRKIFKDKKIEIQNKYVYNNKKIHIHTLDYSIKQLCNNIEAAKTNLLRGNIKRFRIKYWRNDRISKTIEIEKCYIVDNKVCPNILGDIKYYYNGEEVDLCNIDSNVKINYNKTLDQYTLLIPIKTINQTIPNKTSNLISLDPGLRTGEKIT